MKNGNTATSSYFLVAPGVWGIKDIFVNFYMIQNEETNKWVLVDAGLKTSYSRIKKLATSLFRERKPEAIVLTHGHFDHVGSLKRLVEEWSIPVYAHYLELPYLTGKSHYPPPDPTVGGGLMAYMSFMYPNDPIDIGSQINSLPEDGSVPGLKGWRYIHTSGHTPGHISLFRDKDKLLIAGDAFVTIKSESALAVMFQTKKISRPPAYFTTDWESANKSVKQLLALSPEIAATGHGQPMSGEGMREGLRHLCEHFIEEMPSQGRYIQEAAIADANGLLYVPPREESNNKIWLIAAGAALITALTLSIILKNKKKKSFVGFLMRKKKNTNQH